LAANALAWKSNDRRTVMSPIDPAAMYEQFFVPAMFAPWAEVLFGHAALRSREAVLDLACGTGVVARRAAPMVGSDGRVVALDLNPAMLAVARNLAVPSGSRVEWLEGNAMALPFANSSFDVVLCQHGLTFFPDRAAAAREMGRILKPGGRALVLVLQSLERHPVFAALVESLARRLSQPEAGFMVPFALSDVTELRRVFALPEPALPGPALPEPALPEPALPEPVPPEPAPDFASVEILPVSITARFLEPDRFVPLAVASSAAAVPAFVQLTAPERAALLEAVGEDLAAIIHECRQGSAVVFEMFANLVLAIR
jgi:SAM-dependent methyltransferase